jgi:hypothetical protein
VCAGENPVGCELFVVVICYLMIDAKDDGTFRMCLAMSIKRMPEGQP